MHFTGRVAVVTGSGRGLGADYAKFLAANGATVVLNSTSENCIQVCEDINRAGGLAFAEIGDIGSPDFCRYLVEKTIADHDRLDILINNAGNKPNSSLSVSQLDEKELLRVFNVHVLGSYLLCLAAWPSMSANNYGRILNISSSIVLGAPPGLGYSIPHATAKAGIIGLTKSLAGEGAGSNVKINAIMPLDLSPYTPSGISVDASGDGEALLRRAASLHVNAAENLARTVGFLVHEDVPCSGEVFSVCRGRIARIFLGENEGVALNPVTFAQLGDAFDQVMSTESFCVPDSWRDMELGIGMRL